MLTVSLINSDFAYIVTSHGCCMDHLCIAFLLHMTKACLWAKALYEHREVQLTIRLGRHALIERMVWAYPFLCESCIDVCFQSVPTSFCQYKYSNVFQKLHFHVC